MTAEIRSQSPSIKGLGVPGTQKTIKKCSGLHKTSSNDWACTLTNQAPEPSVRTPVLPKVSAGGLWSRPRWEEAVKSKVQILLSQERGRGSSLVSSQTLPASSVLPVAEHVLPTRACRLPPEELRESRGGSANVSSCSRGFGSASLPPTTFSHPRQSPQT